MFSKIAFSEIGAYLPENSIWVCHNYDAAICGIKHFAADDFSPADDYLYICSYEDYKQHAHSRVLNAIVCVPDQAAADTLFTRKNLIAVFSTEDLYKVTTAILSDLSAGARLGASGLAMQNLSLGKKPLDDILEYAYHELGNPLVLTDASFVIIGKVGLNDITREPQWSFAESNGAFPPEFIGNIMHSKNDTQPKEPPLIDDKIILGMNHRQASARIVFAGKTIGYLLVLENNREFDDFDLEFIPMAANIFSLCLKQNDGSLLLSSSFHEDFLSSILSEAITSPEEILLKQETFGIKLKSNLFLISIDLPLATMDSDKTYAFIRKLRLLLKKESIVPYENSIVILYDTDTLPLFRADIDKSDFEALLAEYGCRANISSPFNLLYQTRRHYMQNKMCSTMRSMLHLDSLIIDYQTDIAEYHMIFNYSMVQNLDNLLHPAVFKLREMDKETGSERLDTLFAYTDHLCNLRTTANDLYLHYNTLKYRIDKIASQLNINFDDSAEVYRISLSKKVLQIEEAMKDRK